MGFKIPIKEYLVKVGFDINKGEINDALGAIESTKGKVSSLATNVSKNLATASGAIVGMVATAVVATAKLVDSVADADMQTELLARRMWMSEEAVRSLDTSTKALGMSMDDLNQIALNPELRNQFLELYNVTKQLQAPRELQEQLKLVRSVTFEFKKFKVIASYAIQNVVYYLNKYLGNRLESIKQKLMEINDKLIKNMPQIASKIAKGLYYVVRIVEVLFKVAYKLVSFIYKTFDNMPKRAKIAFAALAAAAMVALKPFNLILLAVGALLLVLEDYVSFTEGKKSAFQGLWEALGDDSMFGGMGDTFQSLAESIDDLFQSLEDLYKLISDATGIDALDVLKSSFSFLANTIKAAADDLERFIDLVNNIAKGDFKKAFSNLGDLLPNVNSGTGVPFMPTSPVNPLFNLLGKGLSRTINQNVYMNVTGANAQNTGNVVASTLTNYANRQLNPVYG